MANTRVSTAVAATAATALFFLWSRKRRSVGQELSDENPTAEMWLKTVTKRDNDANYSS